MKHITDNRDGSFTLAPGHYLVDNPADMWNYEKRYSVFATQDVTRMELVATYLEDWEVLKVPTGYPASAGGSLVDIGGRRMIADSAVGIAPFYEEPTKDAIDAVVVFRIDVPSRVVLEGRQLRIGEMVVDFTRQDRKPAKDVYETTPPDQKQRYHWATSKYNPSTWTGEPACGTDTIPVRALSERLSASQDSSIQLEKRLTAIGGWSVQIFDPLRSQPLLDNGQLLDGENAVYRLGNPGECHDNSRDLARRMPNLKRWVGQALSEDGMWCQHSWCVSDTGEVVETTSPRVAYFGAPSDLIDQACADDQRSRMLAIDPTIDADAAFAGLDGMEIYAEWHHSL